MRGWLAECVPASEAQPPSQRPSSLTAIPELRPLSCLSIHRLLEYLPENRPLLGWRAGQHPSRRASFRGALGTPARWQVGSGSPGRSLPATGRLTRLPPEPALAWNPVGLLLALASVSRADSAPFLVGSGVCKGRQICACCGLNGDPKRHVHLEPVRGPCLVKGSLQM